MAHQGCDRGFLKIRQERGTPYREQLNDGQSCAQKAGEYGHPHGPDEYFGVVH